MTLMIALMLETTMKIFLFSDNYISGVCVFLTLHELSRNVLQSVPTSMEEEKVFEYVHGILVV